MIKRYRLIKDIDTPSFAWIIPKGTIFKKGTSEESDYRPDEYNYYLNSRYVENNSDWFTEIKEEPVVFEIKSYSDYTHYTISGDTITLHKRKDLWTDDDMVQAYLGGVGLPINAKTCGREINASQWLDKYKEYKK